MRAGAATGPAARNLIFGNAGWCSGSEVSRFGGRCRQQVTCFFKDT